MGGGEGLGGDSFPAFGSFRQPALETTNRRQPSRVQIFRRCCGFIFEHDSRQLAVALALAVVALPNTPSQSEDDNECNHHGATSLQRHKITCIPCFTGAWISRNSRLMIVPTRSFLGLPGFEWACLFSGSHGGFQFHCQLQSCGTSGEQVFSQGLLRKVILNGGE